MASHDWSEKDFDWKSLEEACDFFMKLRTIGRIQISGTKEKYGTMRLEWFFWNGHYNEFLHSMIYPGYLHIQWPTWFRRIDQFIITPIAVRIGLCRVITAYQRLVLNIITFIAVKKWPHIKNEILGDWDFDNLLYYWTKKN